MADPRNRVEPLMYRKPRLLRESAEDAIRDILSTRVTPRSPFLHEHSEGQVVLSICSFNHAHYARTLFESVRRFHPDLTLVLVVADAERLGFPEIPGVRMVSPRQMDLPDFPYMALKYSATDLCCSLKPLAVRWLMATHRVRSVVYLDADLCVYAPLNVLLAAAARHRAVVLPHIRAPLPNPERFWERPSLGDLAYAGVLNAGIFALSADEETRAFLDTWSDLVSQPGAFLPAMGGQWEQNSFNWIVSFLDGLHVLRDPAYNAAYWNLHDRSLRWKGLDGDEDRWTVDGEPLVCFHFSGFKPDEPLTLSSHDKRYSLFHMPSLSRLTEDYAGRLRVNEAGRCSQSGYGFEQFNDGLSITPRVRRIFQEDEVYLRRELDPWTPEGEEYYCEALLSPVPHRGSLLPVLLESIYRERPDLQANFPDADVRPERLVPWFSKYGIHEYSCQKMFDRYRQAIPSPWATRHLRSHYVNEVPELIPAIAADHGKATGLLQSTEPEQLRRYAGEIAFISKLAYVRDLYGRRADLREVYREVFFADASRFADWMSCYGIQEELVPDDCITTFLRCSGGRSLARIFSFLNRSPDFVDTWPLALVGEGRDEFAKAMLRVLRHGLEFDVDDIVMYLWMMEDAPWHGVELTLELLPNLARIPSSRLPEGYEAMFGALAARDHRFGVVIRDLLTQNQSPKALDELKAIRAYEKSASQPRRATDFLRVRRQCANGGADGRAPSGSLNGEAAASTRVESGVNLFGFFKSPIGLGEMSRGLSSALATIDVPTSENIVGNVAMDEDLRPSDFIRSFRHDYDRNVFVSYPHLDGMILHQYPGWMTAGRENIVYLAWEQRDGSHYWREVFEGFDQVWALSSFAARSLEQCLERPVHDVPCVLEINKLPVAGTKSQFGLDPNALVVLYVFDANSSIERKNPEAALRAFEAAFGPHDPVQLCIKASNSARLEHRSRLSAFLRDAARLGDRVKIITQNLSREQTMKLISSVDCYMSLHRSEGFGYTCAEAMAYGVPVIATRYSGNLDFMDDQSAYLVDAREVEVQRAEGPFHRGSVWADPNLDSAIHALQTVFARRDDARLVGLRGQAQVRYKLSAEAIGARIASLLGVAHQVTPARDSIVSYQET